mgnify:CR=1 FL=1
MTVLQTIAVAFAMFSALPVPQFEWNEKNMRYAMCAFPLIGLVCGGLWCLCGVLPLPELARAAAERGEPVRIYACGGDGTLNEAVNGAAGFANAAVTNVPKGTGNDFLKIFGADYRSRFSDLAALADGPQACFDLMDCKGRLGKAGFLAHAHNLIELFFFKLCYMP